jgi:hypothetical protein
MATDTDHRIAVSIIEEGIYLALATSSPSGQPWCSPLFYGIDKRLTFVFVSATTSTHAENIRSTGLGSWAVFQGSKGPAETDGLIFGGTAQELTDESLVREFGDLLFDQRYPDPAERATHPVDPRQFAASGRTIYTLTPNVVFKVNRDDVHGLTRMELDLGILQEMDIVHPRTSPA